MIAMLKQRIAIMIWLAVLPVVSGCATVPYKYGQGLERPDTLRLTPGEEQVVRGRPVGFVDGLGHYFMSLPSKLILWDWRVNNHDISPETEKTIKEYLEANGLASVKVRLNQYSPGGEWLRLFRNTAMPGFFRFTFGVLATTMYTILPERVFAGSPVPFSGGDHYNPFTNTLNIYSDNPAILLHEGGHAKDFARKSRGFRGWYALLRLLPLVPLYQEGVATGDAIGYLRQKQQPEAEKEAYKILYPAYATYVGGQEQWLNIDMGTSYLIRLAALVPGHIIGRIKAAGVEDRPPMPEPMPEPGI